MRTTARGDEFICCAQLRKGAWRQTRHHLSATSIVVSAVARASPSVPRESNTDNYWRQGAANYLSQKLEEALATLYCGWRCATFGCSHDACDLLLLAAVSFGIPVYLGC